MMQNKFFSILIILLPILYQYKSPIYSISLGEFLLVPYIFYYILEYCSKVKKIKIEKSLILFCFITVLNTLIVSIVKNYFNFEPSITIIIRMIFYIILIFAAFEYFDFKYAMRLYNKITIVLSIYLIIQYIYTQITGNYLPIYIDYNLLFGPEMRNPDLSEYYMYTFRPSSFFLEPSYFALFSLPVICYNLLYYEECIKYRIFTSLIITISLVLSGASSGIIGVVLIWGVYLYPETIKKIDFKRITIFLVLFLVLIILINSEVGKVALARIQKGGSFGQRIERGIILFKEFDIFNSLFGVGINNLENYMNYYGIKTIYDETNLNYMASIVGVLVNSGVIGIVFYINHFKKLLLKTNNMFCFGMIIIYIFCSSYENMLFSYRMGFYLILIYASINKKSTVVVSNIKVSNYIKGEIV